MLFLHMVSPTIWRDHLQIVPPNSYPWVRSILIPTLSCQLNIFHIMALFHLASVSWSCLVVRLSIAASWCCPTFPSLMERRLLSSDRAVVTALVSPHILDLPVPILYEVSNASSSGFSVSALSDTSRVVLYTGMVSTAPPPLSYRRLHHPPRSQSPLAPPSP